MVPIVPLAPMDHQFDESYPFVFIGHVCNSDIGDNSDNGATVTTVTTATTVTTVTSSKTVATVTSVSTVTTVTTVTTATTVRTATTLMDSVPEYFNPFTPGDFAEKSVFKVLEWFSGHCPAIKR